MTGILHCRGHNYSTPYCCILLSSQRMLMNEDEVKSSVIAVEGERVLFDKSNTGKVTMESIAAPLPTPSFYMKKKCTVLVISIKE